MNKRIDMRLTAYKHEWGASKTEQSIDMKSTKVDNESTRLESIFKQSIGAETSMTLPYLQRNKNRAKSSLYENLEKQFASEHKKAESQLSVMRYRMIE